MRASGQQKIGAIVTFLAYWVIGIPVTCVCVFYYGLSNFGIWVGPTLACAFNTLAYLWIFNKMNWVELVRRQAEQREKDKLRKINEAAQAQHQDDGFQNAAVGNQTPNGYQRPNRMN